MKTRKTVLKAVEPLKMLQVREDAHAGIKDLAKIRRLSIKDYIEYLIEVDQELIEEEKRNRPIEKGETWNLKI